MLTIGHLEANESNMDAAVRETEEEAGIKVQDISIDHGFEKVLTVIINKYSCCIKISLNIYYMMYVIQCVIDITLLSQIYTRIN